MESEMSRMMLLNEVIC